MKKLLVEYNTNNSRGDWWLSTDDWKALELAGWKIKWGDGEFIYEGGGYKYDKDGYPVFISNNKMWLGALARYAWLLCDSVEEALKSFEKATGKDITDEGCNCCGAPHCFLWEDSEGHKSCSGESCGEYLLGVDLTKSKRDLLGL